MKNLLFLIIMTFLITKLLGEGFGVAFMVSYGLYITTRKYDTRDTKRHIRI